MHNKIWNVNESKCIKNQLQKVNKVHTNKTNKFIRDENVDNKLMSLLKNQKK